MSEYFRLFIYRGFARLLNILIHKQRFGFAFDDSGINNDFADILFVLDDDLNSDNVVTHQYSGIEWKIKSNTPLEKGTQVKVVKKEVGVLWVEAV